MKRLKLAALVLLMLCNLVMAADRKAPEKVSTDALTKDSQRTSAADNSIGEKGMYLVWYVPVEFWEATLRQNPQVTKAQADMMVEQMKGVIIVAVMRTQIHAAGQFEFYDESVVRKNLSLQYTGADGKAIALEEKTDISPGATAILAAMKPILQAAMGKMGQNMYFFVYNDVGADGKRLVLPDAPGKLVTNLKVLPGEAGGAIDFLFPLNSLFEPRVCTQCHHGGMDIQWHFCPYCGAKLAE